MTEILLKVFFLIETDKILSTLKNTLHSLQTYTHSFKECTVFLTMANKMCYMEFPCYISGQIVNWPGDQSHVG